MTENVAVYAALIDQAKAGRKGAVLALRSFMTNAVRKMSDELMVELSEVILGTMREKERDDARLN